MVIVLGPHQNCQAHGSQPESVSYTAMAWALAGTWMGLITPGILGYQRVERGFRSQLRTRDKNVHGIFKGAASVFLNEHAESLHTDNAKKPFAY